MIGVFLLVTVQAVPAAVPAPAPSPTTKLRCRRMEETGSYVRAKRVCRTDAEWRALQRREDIELDRLRNREPINQRNLGG